MPKSITADPWKRASLCVLGLLAYLACLIIVGTPVTVFLIVPPWSEEGSTQWIQTTFEAYTEPGWWLYGAVVGLVVALTQLLFLLPVVRVRPPTGDRPRSLLLSLVAGGAVAAALTTALVLGIAELLANVVAGDLSINPWHGDELLGQLWIWPGLLVVVAGSWAGWTGLLLIFSRQLWADSVVARATVLLFGGTVVELVVVLPIDIMVRRRTDCYCASGTFFSMVLSAIAILWLAGPGIVLALTSTRRRLARVTHCGRCGHARGPTPGDACPECGFAWTPGGPGRRSPR